jgi:hypothetical protein
MEEEEMKYVPFVGPVWWLIKYREAATEELEPDTEKEMWADGWRVIWSFMTTIIVLCVLLVFLLRFLFTA